MRLQLEEANARANAAVDALPIDGGVEATVYGVGFAKSPWSKCVVVPPDAGRGTDLGDPTKSPYDFGYDWNDPTPTMLTPALFHNDKVTTNSHLWTEAKVEFAQWDASPRISYAYQQALADDWKDRKSVV